jgi:endonuclease/exonuclease/phosphatase family metal-dependent hydrolase
MLALAAVARGDDLTVVGFNVESGEADIEYLARQVGAFEKVDLWGFSEVEGEEWAKKLDGGAEEGEGAKFEWQLGASGPKDRLAIVWNADRFEALKVFELSHINIEGKVRAPLVAHMKEKKSGVEFFFMVNHLYRGNDAGRHTQGTLLNEWARLQTLPVIAVGDYNFDYALEGGDQGQRDKGFDNMTKDGVWAWVRPATLEGTTPPSRRRARAVLDFVFVANEARAWKARSEIVVRADDFTDPARQSDHRPVKAVFEMPSGAGTGGAAAAGSDPATREARMAELERQVADLEAKLARVRGELEMLRGEE